MLEIVGAFAAVSGREVRYRVVDRRPGDIAECFADPSLAQENLGWKAQRDLNAMIEDAWRWQSQNPTGYDG